jgi:hypothetical protein
MFEKEESDLIIAEQNKSTEEILKAVAKVKSDYHELCKLKDMRIAELEAQIEKLIDFVLSKTECCDVCPITDTCINSEGTCPYAGILSKGEEAVTREWLMQKIAKEIKEK